MASRKFLRSLKAIIPKERILTDDLSRHAYAHDASAYLLIPKVVLKVESEMEVMACLQLLAKHQISVTFRAAGTSLSGQAQSDAVLMVLGQNWRGYTILDEGARIRVQPGLIGSEVNLFLAPYGRKIGPDPASIGAAKIGGIAANNASGMCCGISQNSYHTVQGMRLILADGTILDTESLQSLASFQMSHAKLLEQLSELRKRILNDPGLPNLIREQYRIKNTVGYGLNAFLDFADPIDILVHLMIGSEGTLGFIASITYETVPVYAYEAAALLFFDDVKTACNASLKLPKELISALELMDETALKASKIEGKAALLIDVKSDSSQALASRLKAIGRVIQAKLRQKVAFITERAEYNKIWAIRRGILPAVAGARTPGSALINEDVAVSPHDLPLFCENLEALFKAHGYQKYCIFGHVKDGNLHFLIEERFDTAAGIAKYNALMQAVVRLVLRYRGALKAEHGTGRNMAPFVEQAWGSTAYRIMHELKALLDPKGILNPEVILSKNPNLHQEHLKQFPIVDPLIDRCIECGFCEKVCPSNKLTLTPRQRIVAWRTMQQKRKVFPDFKYRGITTCAATGLCKGMCPVGINTGDMVRKLRFQKKTKLQHFFIRRWIQHFALMMSMMKCLVRPWRWRLGFKQAVYKPQQDQISKSLSNTLKPVYYFPSCAARMFDDGQQALLEKVLRKLGFQMIVVPGAQNQCCGLMFKSKGYLREANYSGLSLEKHLAKTQDAPVLCEMGSCVLQMRHSFKKDQPIYEALDFICDQLEKHPLTQQDKTIMLHVTCSMQRLGLQEKITRLAHRLAKQVVIPSDIYCCGFAGEKGFTEPELNQSALSTLKAQVPQNCTEGYSMSLTCEMGLSKAAGISYRSLLYLIDKQLLG